MIGLAGCSSKSALHDGRDAASGGGGSNGSGGARDGGAGDRPDAGGAGGNPDARGAGGTGGSDARVDASDGGDAADAADAPVVPTSFTATLNRKMDILFVIDNSPSMAPLQGKLAAQFPVFMNVLKQLPSGDGALPALPDLHLALISTNTGPGAYDLPNYQCAFGGDLGRFRSSPTGTCTMSPLLQSQTFFAESLDQTVKNYTGDINDAFTCIARLGEQGCMFGAPLKALRVALDPTNHAPGTEGFVRPDAYLAVIILANQDDCSVPDDSDLFNPSAAGVSAYGPFKRFRCNEFGHLCDVNGNGALQPPPSTGTANNLQGCISNDTATGKLTHIADEVAFLKGLKSDPSQIFVSAITGPPTPYDLAVDTSGDQSVVHSCTQNATEFADPAVRIGQWVQAFGNHGLLETACAVSYAPLLNQIGTELASLLGAPCITSALVDGDLATAGLQPICDVSELYTGDGGSPARIDLPACATNGNTAPCWTIATDAPHCGPANLLFSVNRTGAAPPPAGAHLTVSCQACVPGVPRSGCP